MRLIVYIFTLFLILMNQLVIAYTSGDCTNANDPPSTGNWIIPNTTVCSNTTITLNGSFNITNGGNVTFRNVTLILNLSGNGVFNITVDPGSSFNISQSSNITSVNETKHYVFTVHNGTNFSMTDSYLTDAGWAIGAEDGFIINTTVKEFTRNTIIRNRRGVSFFSSYNNIINNTINITDGSYGIYIHRNSNFNNVSYNTIDRVLDCIVIDSDNNTVSFNTLLNSDVGVQFSLFTTETPDFNNIFNNTAIGNNDSFAIPGGSKNRFYNNIAQSSNEDGFRINGAIDNDFYNNTILNSQITGFDISSHNNRVYENIIGLSSNVNVVIQAFAENNTLWDNFLYNSSVGLRFQTSTRFNVVKDSTLENHTSDITIGGDGNNNTVLNLTFNKTKVSFSFAGASVLSVKWYLNIHVNDTLGNNLQNANITVWDINNNLIFSELTDSDGGINQKNITEYIQNRSLKTFLTNYTINVTKDSFENKTEQLNITQSMSFNIILNQSTPQVTFISPTPENNTNLSSNNFTINISHIESNPDRLILNWNGVNESQSYSGSFTNITKNNLTDGNYTFYVWINNTGGKSNQTETRFIKIDKTPPSLYLSIPDYLIFSGSSLKIDCSASDVSSEMASTTLTVTKPSGISVEHMCGSYFTDTSGTGTYTVIFSATDSMGNSASTSVEFRTLSVSSMRVDVKDSGIPVKEIAENISEIRKNNINDVIIENMGNVFYKVLIKTNKKSQEDIRLEINELYEKPFSIEPPSDIIYKYIEIKYENINENDIGETIIEFKIEKSWVEDNRIAESTITLNRYENRWEKVPTSLLMTDDKFNYYKSYVSGLSFFAVTGKRITEEKNKGPSGFFKFVTKLENNEIILLILTLLIIVIFGIMVIYKINKKIKSRYNKYKISVFNNF